MGPATGFGTDSFQANFGSFGSAFVGLTDEGFEAPVPFSWAKDSEILPKTIAAVNPQTSRAKVLLRQGST